MKTSKRILSLLLVMVFVLTATITTPVFAAFSDVDGTEPYAAAISSLNSLGIINGYEDGTFRPLNNVTRAEFTALLLRARGFGDIGSTDLNDPPYPDVVTSDVSWAIGNIRTARDMGIVTGYEDGTFRPMNNVLYEEAITMIVRAIGYENSAAEGGEWYSKYLTIAGSIGLLKNVNGAINVPATRAVIAMMLDNLLNLEDESGYIQKTGVILSNRLTSLNSPNVDLRENEILIEDDVTRTATKYLVDDVKVYDEMMGQRVDFSYKENKETGYNEIKSITPRKSNVLEIKSKDIEDAKCDTNTVVYYEDGVKQKKVVISPNSVVVYNGKLYGTSRTDSKYSDYFTQKGLPVVGDLKLLDNDNDNKYDVVFVDNYDIYIVSNVTTGTRTITDKVIRNNETKVLDYEKDKLMKFVDTKGYELSFSSIVKGSVLCIKESNAANGSEVLTTVVINNTNPSGTVTGAKVGKSITLSSTTYNYSDAAPWVNGSGLLTEPQLDDSAKFYLDLNGDVVGYEKSQVQVNQKYGYISSYQVIEINMESVLKVTMFVPGTSGLTNFKTDSKTKINGAPDKTPEEIKTILDTAAAFQGQSPSATNNAYSQLIKFTATGDVLNEIITAEPSDPVQTLATDKLIISKSYSPADDDSRTASSKSKIKSNVAGEKTIEAVIGSGTTLISVPNDRSYAKGYSKIEPTQMEINKGYYVEVYDIKGSEPKVIVFYNMDANVNKAKADTVPFIITELVGVGDNIYEVYGYNGKSETTLKTPLKSSPDSYAAFKALADDNGGKGYVVRFGKDVDGNVTLDEKNIIFSNDSSLRATVMSNHASANHGWTKDGDGCFIKGSNLSGTTYEMIWGYVNSVGESYVEILDDANENATHIYTSYKDALVLKYEKAGGSFDIIKLEDGVAAALDTETAKFAETNPTEVFVYGTNGTTLQIVIIKE